MSEDIIVLRDDNGRKLLARKLSTGIMFVDSLTNSIFLTFDELSRLYGLLNNAKGEGDEEK